MRLRYFNYGGSECWYIDLDDVADAPKTDDVFLIEKYNEDQCALVDFSELRNLRMHAHPDYVLQQIVEHESGSLKVEIIDRANEGEA